MANVLADHKNETLNLSITSNCPYKSKFEPTLGPPIFIPPIFSVSNRPTRTLKKIISSIYVCNFSL